MLPTSEAVFCPQPLGLFDGFLAARLIRADPRYVAWFFGLRSLGSLMVFSGVPFGYLGCPESGQVSELLSWSFRAPGCFGGMALVSFDGFFGLPNPTQDRPILGYFPANFRPASTGPIGFLPNFQGGFDC